MSDTNDLSDTDDLSDADDMSDAEDMAYDREALADLESVFGKTRVAALLAGLRDEIDRRLATPAVERDGLGRDAHVLVSVSGTLGFMPLSRACAELERACLGIGDVAPALARAQAQAAAAKRAIDGLTAP